jgi:hypothetical protein
MRILVRRRLVLRIARLTRGVEAENAGPKEADSAFCGSGEAVGAGIARGSGRTGHLAGQLGARDEHGSNHDQSDRARTA